MRYSLGCQSQGDSVSDKRRRKTTATELLSRLGNDAEYVRAGKEGEQARVRRAVELRDAERPLLADLAQAGISVNSVWDLVNTRSDYSRVMPVLLKHLKVGYPIETREGIARALAIPQARSRWSELVSLFRTASDARFKWALGCALSVAAGPSEVRDVVELLLDRSHGQARLALVSALEALAGPERVEVLESLSTDPDTANEALRLLRLAKGE